MTGAALIAGLNLAGGGRLGLVVFGQMSLGLYQDLLRAEQFGDAIGAIEVISVDTSGGYLAPDAHDGAVIAAIARLAAAGVGAVLICGAAVVGIARRSGGP